MRHHPVINFTALNYSAPVSIEISGIQFHSAKVKKGDLFVAIPGLNVDGHDYIQDAIAAGAAAVIGERDLTGLPVPYYRVANSRLALAQIASQFYQHPSRRHTMIGITGTNGKTTTAHLLRHIIESAGISCSLFGTVSHQVNGVKLRSNQTTPDALQLQQWLDQSRDRAVVMEVSSHGIDQERVSGIDYDYTVFTNLSHEHLDYHETIYDYFLTKARLFQQLKQDGEAIVSSRCEWGKRLIDQLWTQHKTVYTYGENAGDHLQIVRVQTEYPLKFDIREGDQYYEVSMPLPGIYNAWNTAAAWLTARRMGIDPGVIRHALTTFSGVPGRFECYPHPRGAQFIVDYAHTPDGFYHFLKTLHARKHNRIIHIFGFRGNRDRSKRQAMLQISAEWSDQIILTLDDLGGVDADSLLREFHKLADRFGKGRCMVIADRTKAIEYAWQRAEEDDLIAVTGKGRETYDQSFSLPAQSDPDTLQYLSNR